MKIPRFTLGLILGSSIGALLWYWQKSTSAEEGAMAVLDRLAIAETRVRNLESRLRESAGRQSPEFDKSKEPIHDDLQIIDGIGPTYSQRLNDAGVTSFGDLAALTPDRLREIVDLKDWQAFRAEDWINAAKALETA